MKNYIARTVLLLITCYGHSPLAAMEEVPAKLIKKEAPSLSCLALFQVAQKTNDELQQIGLPAKFYTAIQLLKGNSFSPTASADAGLKLYFHTLLSIESLEHLAPYPQLISKEDSHILYNTLKLHNNSLMEAIQLLIDCAASSIGSGATNKDISPPLSHYTSAYQLANIAQALGHADLLERILTRYAQAGGDKKATLAAALLLEIIAEIAGYYIVEKQPIAKTFFSTSMSFTEPQLFIAKKIISTLRSSAHPQDILDATILIRGDDLEEEKVVFQDFLSDAITELEGELDNEEVSDKSQIKKQLSFLTFIQEQLNSKLSTVQER